MEEAASTIRDAVEAAQLGGAGEPGTPRHKLLETAGELANLLDRFATATSSHSQKDMVLDPPSFSPSYSSLSFFAFSFSLLDLSSQFETTDQHFEGGVERGG
jgi:hypothetical protein